MWFMNRCGANPSIRWSCWMTFSVPVGVDNDVKRNEASIGIKVGGRGEISQSDRLLHPQ